MNYYHIYKGLFKAIFCICFILCSFQCVANDSLADLSWANKDSKKLEKLYKKSSFDNTNKNQIPTNKTQKSETAYNTIGCFEHPVETCSNSEVSPYDDPVCFMNSVYNNIKNHTINNYTYYVAIFQEEYMAQGFQGCPFDMTLDENGNQYCPFGSDDNDGLSIETPLASFKKAFEIMYTHKKEGTKEGRYTLIIRGGDFFYTEPLVIAGNEIKGGVQYKVPLLYDENGQEIKADSDGNIYYYGKEGYEEASKYIASDIRVKPFDNKEVKIDGTCEFSYNTGTDNQLLMPGHPEFTYSATAMKRSCLGSRWGDYESDSYTQGFFNTMGMVSIHNAHNISIEGLTIQNAPSFGIVVYGASENVIIKNNNVDNTYASGIAALFNPENIIIDNNNISRACAGSKHENISIKNNANNVVVINNTIKDNYNDAGIDISADNVYVGQNKLTNVLAGAIYIAADTLGSHHVWVNGNMTRDSIYGGCITIASEQRGPWDYVKVSNNVCVGTTRGIWIGGYFHLIGDNADLDPTVVGVPMDNIFVYNNTVYGTGNDTVGYGSNFSMTNPGATNVNVFNNIFYSTYKNTTSFQYVLQDDGELNKNIINFTNNITFCNDSAEVDEDGNLVCLSDNTNEKVVDGNLQLDPLFVDPENGDFHLQAGSPAINIGVMTPLMTNYDFECDQRIFQTNTLVDIGADEYY